MQPTSTPASYLARSTIPYPLLFEPLLKPKVWGGRRLSRWGKTLPPETLIGESWELADLPSDVPGGRSVIRNGPWAGLTIRDLIDQLPKVVLGAARPSGDGGFPLLIKFLDARQNLSVQVHPDQAYVAAHPEAHLKSEAWIILEAEPGAVIYRGLRAEVTKAKLRADLRSQAVLDNLIPIPVAAGECHYLPSGTCHALGAGILVAEVQTPSDTTFRLYDWGRTDRPLHVEEALECVHFGPVETTPPPPPITCGPLSTQPLLHTQHFHLERIDAEERGTFPVVTNEQPEAWMLLAGTARIESYSSVPVTVAQGETVLIPAALRDAHAVASPGTSILRVTLPSTISGLLATG